MADGCGDLLRLFFKSFCAPEKSHIILNKRREESTLKPFDELVQEDFRWKGKRRGLYNVERVRGGKERAVQGKSRPSRERERRQSA